jgi:hypothetical protein
MLWIVHFKRKRKAVSIHSPLSIINLCERFGDKCSGVIKIEIPEGVVIECFVKE